MKPVPPFWFLMRQGKMESVAPETYRLTAPNLQEAYISVRKSEPGGWLGVFRLQPDGADAGTAPAETEPGAWEAAFELYRLRLVV